MSNEHYDIDTDGGLAHFDPYDMRSSGRRQTLAPSSSIDLMSPNDIPFAGRKGKQVSMPMPIRSHTIIHDVFDGSPSNTDAFRTPSSSNFSSFASSSFTFSSPGSSSGSYRPLVSTSFSQALGLEALEEGPTAPPVSDPSAKGKSREMAPSLPPLTLDSAGLGDDDVWMSFDPSSFSSTSPLSATSETVNDFSCIGALLPSSATDGSPMSCEDSLPVATRCRSLSSLSIESAAPSTTVNTRSKSKASSLLARKLLSRRKTDESNTRPTSPSGLSSAMSSIVEIPNVTAAVGNAPRQWYTAPKTTEAIAVVSRPPHPIPILALETAITFPASRSTFKHKGRSHSTPLPFSALDYVPIASTDIFKPLPLFVKNYFDDIIPRELRLNILGSLLQVHFDSHRKMVTSGRWSVNRASSSRNQWVGRDRGLKELIRLSRVSKSWHSLVYDGQLWVDLDLHSFPGLPREVLQRITKSAGPFIQSINAAGLTYLDSEDLLDVTSDLCLKAPQGSLSYTQLTSVSLQGCTGLTTRSLHHLLIRSRSLETLNLRGLGAVTNTTCEILATYCSSLRSLNLNRCMNMDADGIHYMASAALARGEQLRLKELRLCGLKHSSDSMMGALGRAAPHLEVLDLSYARRLHNSALEAFVACDEGEEGFHHLEVDTVLVFARELDREVNDVPYFRRRVTRLRHLNLSFCLLLTDTACVNLAYSLPQLEYLEMAGIGADLREAGLIRLFGQTPCIKRVDLEDAVDVGDALLASLTPVPEQQPPSDATTIPNSIEPPQSGHVLQHLNISSSLNVTDQGLLSLIRRCPKLTSLEADGTRMNSVVLREFVRLNRERQSCDAKIAAVDCRGIGENVVKELSGSTRPRLGWRSYAARKLYYLDERDGNEDDLTAGQDECDEKRVVVKSFYSWQTVDAVKTSREKRKKSAGSSGASRRTGNGSNGADWDEVVGGRMRWWLPGGRRSSASGRGSPVPLNDVNDGCRAM